MAAKLQLITELSERTAISITKKPDSWTGFLKTAAWNYKYPFQDQLLIYAQRPDATACATIELWNQKLARWVNKGAKGIALIDDSGSRLILRHVFDLSDTNSRYDRPVMLWSMQDKYEEAVVETLENTFGELEEKQDMTAAIFSAVRNAVEDNFPDYLSDLMNCRENSFLEELDELNVEVSFRESLKSSISYMVLLRCGYNADEMLKSEDFLSVFSFNTLDTVSRLGAAVSDISEMLLRDIEATVKELQKEEKNKNGTFAKTQKKEQDKNRIQSNERMDEHGADLLDPERLSDPRSDASGGGNAYREIRDAAQDLSEEPPKGNVHQPDAVGQAEQPSFGHRSDSEGTHRTDNLQANKEQPSPGQDDRPHGLDRTHEQPQTLSGGSGADRAGIQITLFPTIEQQMEAIEQAEDKKTSAFSIPQEEIDALLCKGTGFQNGKYRVYLHYQEQNNLNDTINFLKQEYGIGGGTHIFTDGTTGTQWHDGKGISLTKNGSFITNPDVRLNWNQAAKRLRELIALDRYLNSKEKEYLPEYKQEMEEHRQQLAEEAYARKILNREPEAARKENLLPEDATGLELRLGDTVYLGAEEYEIHFLNDQMVGLSYIDYPLLTKEIQRDAFERLLRENPLNHHLLRRKEQEQLPQKETEPADPTQLYHRYLPILISKIQSDAVYTYLRDRETHPDSAKEELTAVIERIILSMKEENLAFFEAYTTLPQFKEWFNEDVFQRTYQDYLTEPKDSVSLHADDPDAPEWARTMEKQPAEKELYIGQELSIEDRRYSIDSIHHKAGKVSLRDITFQSGVGFPIFRSESIEYIRSILTKANETIGENTQKPKVPEAVTELPKAAPKQALTNFRINDDSLGIGGPKTKYAWNIAAIKLLNSLEEENRPATPEEQESLSRYVGWGGLPQVFDEQNTQWTKEYIELKALLTDDEYAQARASTLNAHFTSSIVIKAMYACLANMGFKSGNILEPACGVGNFLGLLPESMHSSKLYGIELDSITGRIARYLYPKSNIAVQGFEETNLPDSFFDLAIGNVPFGSYGIADKKYDKYRFYIHDYFFAKTLDKIRPGGIIAFITSKGTMDKQNPEVRKYIAQRAELLGAVRLPNNAFLANAGTEVTTDILFLQKRDRVIDIDAVRVDEQLAAKDTGPDWIHLSTTPDGIPINQYFADHPEMVLGTMAFDERMYGNKSETTCIPYEDSNLAELLREALENIHAEITEYELDELSDERDSSIPADPRVRNFSYTVVDGAIYYRENSRMNRVETSVTAEGRIKGMIALRDCVRDLIEYQTEDYSDEAIREQQRKLNQLYDAFVDKYGLLNSRGNSMAFSDDSSYCLLCSLEILNENGELERKADMFTKRTIRQRTTVTHVDTATEALAISIAEKACVDMGLMQSLTGFSEEQLAKDLEGVIFRNPTNFNNEGTAQYETADAYLSGNVREKLKTARQFAGMHPDIYGANVTALEAVQPKDLNASEIDVRIGATWLPPEEIMEFIFELLETPYMYRRYMDVHYSAYTANWNIKGKSDDRSDNIKANVTYGTRRINAYKIIEESLNLRDVRIFDTVMEEGVEKRVLNKKETAIAQQKQEAIKEAFQSWIWKEPKRRERLTRLYNDRFNSIRPREYDGSHIRFTGMNPEISLRKHQVDAVAHILYGGNTLLAHCVGAGKTYEMTAAAQESKHLGLCQKSMFVVPNHLTEQWLRP